MEQAHDDKAITKISNPKTDKRDIILMIVPMAYPCEEAVMEEIFAKRLNSYGFDVHWVMMTENEIKEKQLEWHKSIVHLFKLPKGFVRLLLFIKHQIKAWKLAGELCPQIWFVRNSIPSAFVGLYARKWFRCNLVYQISFPFPETYTLLSKKERRLGWPLKYLYWKVALQIRNFIIKRCDLVLPISPVMAADYLKCGAQQDKLFPLPMGGVIRDISTDCTQMTIRNSIEVGNRPVILYFGAIHQLREIDILIKAMPFVLSKVGDAVLVLLGPVTSDYHKKLEILKENLKLKDCVKFASPVPREKVCDWITTANVTISPIPLEDYYVVSSPTKAVESLACGTPIVATRIPDQQELIEKSGGGICVDFTPEGLADGICDILSNPQRAKQMGQAGREYIQKYRSYDVLAVRMAERFHGMLENPF